MTLVGPTKENNNKYSAIESLLSFLKVTSTTKTITTQNVSSEAQVQIFLFCQKVIFHSQDIQVFCIFNYPVIYQICDVMMSIIP